MLIVPGHTLDQGDDGVFFGAPKHRRSVSDDDYFPDTRLQPIWTSYDTATKTTIEP